MCLSFNVFHRIETMYVVSVFGVAYQEFSIRLGWVHCASDHEHIETWTASGGRMKQKCTWFMGLLCGINCHR